MRQNNCLCCFKSADETRFVGQIIHTCRVGGFQMTGDAVAASSGGWSTWTLWSECSRSCDGGASYQQRQCAGGMRCIGDSIRYRTCNNDVRLHTCVLVFRSVGYFPVCLESYSNESVVIHSCNINLNGTFGPVWSSVT